MVLDVQGVGYTLLIPASSFHRLPEVGQTVRLFTHLYLNANTDTLALYGFSTETERLAFQQVIAVSGIGPKMGLAVLSAMSPAELQDALVAGDASMLTKIPGVGKKLAERMVLELRDRFAALPLQSASPLGAASPEKAAERADALSALEALGLSRAAAEKKLRLVLKNNPQWSSAEELIRLALRENG